LADDNCVGLVDNDGDGYTSDVDCDDNNIAINPAALEVCDGIDNNCNIEIDEFVSTEYYADLDGDGFGDVNNTIFDCAQPAGYVTNFDDCDDTNVTFQDNDGDGDGSAIIDACGVTSNSDCDDSNPTVSSLAVEICENGIDDDCVGVMLFVWLLTLMQMDSMHLQIVMITMFQSILLLLKYAEMELTRIAQVLLTKVVLPLTMMEMDLMP
jgi:hypothetical protein